MLSSRYSIVSITANAIGNAIDGYVQQNSRETFVEKPIVKILKIARDKIKKLSDGTRERDAVAQQKLRAYFIIVSADAKFALYSAMPSIEANDLQYVTRAALVDLNYLNQAELPRQVALLIEKAKTQKSSYQEARRSHVRSIRRNRKRRHAAPQNKET